MRPRNARVPALPQEDEELGELSCDAVTAEHRLYQRKKGHRYSLDDVLTAWEAARLTPAPSTYLDLGSGVGSVLTMVAYAQRAARLWAVEAQRGSFALLERNARENQLLARACLVHGDLREAVGQAPLTGPFELITGTPPYVPPGTATCAPDAQKAYARQELRGGVEGYLEAAARVLAAQGHLVVCADARFPERVETPARTLGLTILSRRDAVPRAGLKGPLFSVFVLKRGQGAASYPITIFHARDADGRRSEESKQVRAFFGLSQRE